METRGGNIGRHGEETCKYTRTRGAAMESEDSPGSAVAHPIIDHGLPSLRCRYWKLEEIEDVVEQGTHKSALADDAIAQMQVEAREKAAQGFAKIYT